MKFLSFVCSTIFFVTSILTMPISANAEEPTLTALMKSAPVIDSSDKEYKSIQLEGFWNDDDGRTIIKFRSLYRAPDQYSLLLTDGRDGTPIVLASQGKMLVYDPLEGCVHYYPKANTETLIGLDKGLFQYNFPMWIEGNDPSRIRLDVRSLLNGPSRSDKITRIGDVRYRLTRTSDAGNLYIFDINEEKKCIFQKVELFMTVNSKTRFCIDNIVIDGALDDKAFEFPEVQKLTNLIPVRLYSGARIVNSVQGLGDLTRTFYTRFWAIHPEGRDSPNFANLFGMAKIDWDLIRENDKKYARTIKEIVLPKR